MMFISYNTTLLAIVVIYFIGVQCDANDKQQSRILQKTTPAPTPSSLRDELLYDPGSFCKPQNIIDASPTYTTTAIQCGNYCNPTIDKWYFTGFMLLGEDGTICRCLVDSSIINTDLQLTPDSTPPEGGEGWSAYIGYTERSEVDTQTSTFFALNVRVDDPFDYFDVYCFRQTDEDKEEEEEDDEMIGSKDDGNNVAGTADEDEDCKESSPIFGTSKSSKRRSKSGKQYWSIKMSLNVDTMMDQFNMKPKSSKRHCKSSKSSKIQGKTDKLVYGKSHKEDDDDTSDHTFSNALQRSSLSNNGGDRRLKNRIYATSLASIVACWIIIM